MPAFGKGLSRQHTIILFPVTIHIDRYFGALKALKQTAGGMTELNALLPYPVQKLSVFLIFCAIRPHTSKI